MILSEHAEHHRRLFPFMRPRMLMLGNQQNVCGLKFPCEYEKLDPDGGDHKIDLNNPLSAEGSATTPAKDFKLYDAFETVYNLGTLEHVWDVHQAYENAARMVKLGGFFIGHSPIAGYEGHGIHVTDWRRITDFFHLNGFTVADQFFTHQDGSAAPAPSRNCGRSVILWFAAKKTRPYSWLKPQQIYNDGVKQ